MGIADKTPLASPDHWQAMQITDAAVFYSRLTKWDEFFAQLPVHTIKGQVWFPLGLRSANQASQENALFIDISETLEQKISAIKAYETQFPPAKSQLFDMVSTQNKAWGAASGFAASEMLYSSSPLGTKNLMHALFP
jgi:LmbE family N-acetylglucosaminyl deacetylase